MQSQETMAFLALFTVYHFISPWAKLNQPIFINYLSKLIKTEKIHSYLVKGNLRNGQVKHSDAYKHTYQSAKASI